MLISYSDKLIWKIKTMFTTGIAVRRQMQCLIYFERLDSIQFNKFAYIYIYI